MGLKASPKEGGLSKPYKESTCLINHFFVIQQEWKLSLKHSGKGKGNFFFDQARCHGVASWTYFSARLCWVSNL